MRFVTANIRGMSTHVKKTIEVSVLRHSKVQIMDMMKNIGATLDNSGASRNDILHQEWLMTQAVCSKVSLVFEPYRTVFNADNIVAMEIIEGALDKLPILGDCDQAVS